MSVELDPVELGFRRPFTQEVAETLRLKNPNSDPVAFKVKTTAPKQYCVRPNSGRIEAGQYVAVQVLLQAMKEDPPLDAKCRDKFLVQSVAVPADQEFTNVASIWQNVEQNAKGAVQEKKIRVSFLPADGTVSTPARSGQVEPSEEPPAYASPVSANQSPAVGSVSKPESRPADSRNLGDAVNSASNPAVAGTPMATATGGISSSAQSVSDELKYQLAQANEKISQLTKQVQEQGLRQRKTEAVNQDAKESITSGVTNMAQENIPGGVQVPIVAALCLLSFLLAYLFF